MTILLYVRRKAWPVRSVTVENRHERVPGRKPDQAADGSQLDAETIRQHIRIHGDLTVEQADRVAKIARRCLVYRTLKSSPEIVDDLEVVRG